MGPQAFAGSFQRLNVAHTKAGSLHIYNRNRGKGKKPLENKDTPASFNCRLFHCELHLRHNSTLIIAAPPPPLYLNAIIIPN